MALEDQKRRIIFVVAARGTFKFKFKFKFILFTLIQLQYNKNEGWERSKKTELTIH